MMSPATPQLPTLRRLSPAELQEQLRRRREEKTATSQPPTEAPPAPTPAGKARTVEPIRNRLDAQEEAYLEAMIRRAAASQELDDWRKERRIHHKTFGAAVTAIRRRIEAGVSPSPAAVQIAALERATPPAESPTEPPAVIVSAPARPAQIQPVIDWLATLRAMRDELAAHGVTVAGSLRIEIEL